MKPRARVHPLGAVLAAMIQALDRELDRQDARPDPSSRLRRSTIGPHHAEDLDEADDEAIEA